MVWLTVSETLFLGQLFSCSWHDNTVYLNGRVWRAMQRTSQETGSKETKRKKSSARQGMYLLTQLLWMLPTTFSNAMQLWMNQQINPLAEIYTLLCTCLSVIGLICWDPNLQHTKHFTICKYGMPENSLFSWSILKPWPQWGNLSQGELWKWKLFSRQTIPISSGHNPVFAGVRGKWGEKKTGNPWNECVMKKMKRAGNLLRTKMKSF